MRGCHPDLCADARRCCAAAPPQRTRCTRICRGWAGSQRRGCARHRLRRRRARRGSRRPTRTSRPRWGCERLRGCGARRAARWTRGAPVPRHFHNCRADVDFGLASCCRAALRAPRSRFTRAPPRACCSCRASPRAAPPWRCVRPWAASVTWPAWLPARRPPRAPRRRAPRRCAPPRRLRRTPRSGAPSRRCRAARGCRRAATGLPWRWTPRRAKCASTSRAATWSAHRGRGGARRARARRRRRAARGLPVLTPGLTRMPTPRAAAPPRRRLTPAIKEYALNKIGHVLSQFDVGSKEARDRAPAAKSGCNKRRLCLPGARQPRPRRTGRAAAPRAARLPRSPPPRAPAPREPRPIAPAARPRARRAR
jgi:hypothetical protein